MSTTVPAAPLWHRRDAVGPLVVGGVGVVFCVVAWWLAAGDRQFRDELSLATVSVVGLVLIVGAETAWVLRGRAIVGRRIRALLGTVPPRATRPVFDAGGDLALVAGPGLRWYHYPSCPLAEGLGWPATARDEHVRAGRQPCGVCRPHGFVEEAAV